MTYLEMVSEILRPIVSLATIGGIVIALLQFQLVLRNRRTDLAATRFDHTIQAYEFYQNNVAQTLDDTITRYQLALKRGHFNRVEEGRLGLSVIVRAMLTADFGECFQRLNVLESYVYYDEVDKFQLYSSIGDHISKLMQLEGFETIQEYYLNENVMDNYVYLLADINTYVTERRQRHD